MIEALIPTIVFIALATLFWCADFLARPDPEHYTDTEFNSLVRKNFTAAGWESATRDHLDALFNRTSHE